MVMWLTTKGKCMSMKTRLVHPKDRPHKGTKANVIYRLKCEEPNCNNTYIGETSRPLKVGDVTQPPDGCIYPVEASTPLYLGLIPTSIKSIRIEPNGTELRPCSYEDELHRLWQDQRRHSTESLCTAPTGSVPAPPAVGDLYPPGKAEF
ncbi:hypothetical protein Bbelb_343250 [Branchiostoma belcheri]|nr:hypothetical protein Bbelb_343250 [Branchiostoma belcheri]